MRIKVNTSTYEYQGLYKDTVIDNAEYFPGTHVRDIVKFKHNGKDWVLDRDDVYWIDNWGEVIPLKPNTNSAPIKSDGGSSSYYDRVIPEHYLKLMVETGIVKTEYLIDILFKNDFDFACTFKALVRAKGITEGAGKEGNTLDYELNKMDYYEARIKEKYGWRESD